MVTFSTPLLEGRLLKRYKRFLADVELPGGEVVVAHCVNTGSMKSCGEPGAPVYLSSNDNPNRKLRYTWELTGCSDGFIGVNTSLPNAIVEAGWRDGRIHELRSYETVRREVKYGENSRIDLLLQSPTKPLCYVEVKNVTYLDGNYLRFPDARSERARKHVHELVALHQKTGARIVLFYLANRPEGASVRLAEEIDPAYASAMREGVEQGLEVLCYRTVITLHGLEIGAPLPVELDH